MDETTAKALARDADLMVMHEGNVELHYKRDGAGEKVPDAALNGLIIALRSVREGAERLASLCDALKADETQSNAAKALKLRQHALKLGEELAQRLDAAKAKTQKEIEAIELQTSAPPVPTAALAVQLESEMRTALRSMKADQRDKMLGDLGDAVASAVLRGHAALAGLSDAEQKMYRSRWRAECHPMVADRIARLRNAVEAADRGGKALVAFIKRHSDTETAKRAETGAARVAEALEAAR